MNILFKKTRVDEGRMNRNLINDILINKNSTKYLHILSGFYVAVVLVSLIVSARIFPFHIPLTQHVIFLTGGTWTIPLTFFIQDITTERYGPDKSRQLVFTAVIIAILAIVYFKITTFLPATNMVKNDVYYNNIFNTLPRHLLAFLLAIAAGNLINNSFLVWLKKRWKGKYLPLRFISATAVGEATLQVIGTSIAWLGILNFSKEILPFVIFSYGYKLLFEVAMTPAAVYICKILKHLEEEN